MKILKVTAMKTYILGEMTWRMSLDLTLGIFSLFIMIVVKRLVMSGCISQSLNPHKLLDFLSTLLE